jgi:hypothetical protein
MNLPSLSRLGMFLLMMLAFIWPRPAAALVEPINPSLIITDAEFNDAYAMSCDAVQAFLNGRTGVLKSYSENGKTAAQIICGQANRFSVNPRMILVLLQKEQGLLGDPQPDQAQFDWATGCAPGWSEARGFSNQIECAARTLRNRFDDASMGDVIDGVIPVNRGTLALYRYNNNQNGVHGFVGIWTRYWPQSAAGDAPSEIDVDATNLETTPAVKDPCNSGWVIGTQGLKGYHLVTPNASGQADSTNSAIWRPNIQREGAYQVSVFIPDRAAIPWTCGGGDIVYDTSHAHYTVKHRDGTNTYEVDQAPLQNAWVNIGTYFFAKGTDDYILLNDQTGEPSMSRYVSFDEARFVWVAP